MLVECGSSIACPRGQSEEEEEGGGNFGSGGAGLAFVRPACAFPTCESRASPRHDRLQRLSVHVAVDLDGPAAWRVGARSTYRRGDSAGRDGVSRVAVRRMPRGLQRRRHPGRLRGAAAASLCRMGFSALGRRCGRDGRRVGANRCCGQPGTELSPLGACAPRRFPDPTLTPRHPGPRSTLLCPPDPVSSWSPTLGLMAETATADTPC